MIKCSLNALMCVIFISFFSLSQATPITNLTQIELDTHDYANAEDHLTDGLLGVNYINYKGYDWAWGSPVNLEDYYGQNTLYAPELQKNWQFADQTLLDVLKTELTLADFTDSNGDIIHSAQFFNSDFHYVDTDNFIFEFLSSEWIAPDAFMANFFGQYETFYVRIASNSIPEPSTLMIFALSLIALVSRKKSFK